MNKAGKSTIIVFLPGQYSAEFVEPCKQALDLPTALVAAQSAPIVRDGLNAIALVRRNHLNAVVRQSCIERITVIGMIEVKSMTGSLEDRPVGLSRTQFDCALGRGATYWLYVVEYATDPFKSQVLRIQDPVAHARTFTFDHGWCLIAQTESPC